jgi:hypothetical protein
VLRREAAALGRLSKRTGDDAAAWRAGVEDFYNAHVDFVVEALGLSRSYAVEYARSQQRLILELGAEALETWEERCAEPLAALIMEAE